MATPDCFLGHFTWIFFPRFLIWDSVCLCYWDLFPIFSKMSGPDYIYRTQHYICIVSLCLFIGNRIHCCWEILRTNDCCFLLFLLLKVELCFCGSLILEFVVWRLISCFFMCSSLLVLEFSIYYPWYGCLNFILSWNILVPPSIVIESFAGYSSLG